MKKLFALLVLAGLIGSTLGCGGTTSSKKDGGAPPTPDKKTDEKPKP